ncbi:MULTISPECIES: DUF4177 domain-containing protein [Sphingobacterium]|jgi:hypothetical protein|uniref:DUF4177 domain-containing protein n=2 Tax=Sphingobacterium TaxID=28453 RepID=A0A2X2L5I7_SPHMU|nr:MULTISPECIES: DUF4177 domain-containing protein [Sphingobacterium]HAE69912.1 DUF4177 domain-containing protein [Sphingobacterium sp.]MDF2853220.1 hypothetical protein [Sphingobacterium multivorum]QQT43869.1 DUF4177 domain-containing protein [Sphingobacterium multivorum]QQT63378.1 DUF4177 domain-containing protein [Sphingobacterium multivorum]QRQ61446.1 DUF4177 domain-containing protein [Sphingobacterium multivorum]
MMKRFEYKTLKIEPKGFWGTKLDPEKIDEILNDLGNQGWELVTMQDLEVNGNSWSFHYTFKREKI